MVWRPDAILNLASLLKNDPSSGDEVAEEGLLMPEEALLEADGLRLQDPLAWSLTVRSTGGDDDYLVMGSVSGTAVIDCRRCLTDVPTTLSTDLIYPMVYRPGAEGLALLEGDDDEEEVLVFGRPEVDFAPLLTQVFAIDLPLTALCKEGCRGLSVDGVDLNKHPEHQPPEESPQEASPFEVLKNLDI